MPACQRGNVSIITALGLPALIGALGLAVEIGNGYAVKVRNQAVADTAAMSGAIVYSASTSDSQMEQAARDAAAASGIAATDISATVTAAPDGSGDQAVFVSIITPQAYSFAQIFGLSGEFDISAQSYARIGAGGASDICIIMLQNTSGNGVYINGGSHLTATDCEVQANGAMSANGGSSATAKTFYSQHGIAPVQWSGSSITTSPTPNDLKQNQPAVSDPLAGNSAIAAGLAKLGNYTPVQVPVMSFSGGGNFSPGWWPLTYSHSGKSGSYSGNTWTFPSGTYNINNLSVAGGQKVVFNGPVTLNISGSITSTGAGLTIGAGTTNSVNVKGNITTSGGSWLTVGDGPFAVLGNFTGGGGTPTTIGNGRHYFGRVTTGGNMTIGDGDLDMNGTLLVTGGFHFISGDGDFAITKSSGNSRAIDMGWGGNYFTVGDGEFSANGDFHNGGSSSVTFGDAVNHYINGALTLGGTVNWGKGNYIINGNFVNNTTGTMTGSDVTFVLAGYINMGGSANLNVQAPTSGSSWGIEDMLFITQNSANTIFTGGSSSNNVSGILYAPNSHISITSGGGLGTGGTCWGLVGQTLTMNGGTSLSTRACDALGGSGSGGGGSNVELIQ